MSEQENSKSPEQTPVGETPPAEQEGAPVQNELNDLMDRLKRVTADYQNYQKRVAREIVESRKFANAELVKDLLAVVDDLERALSVSAATPEAAAVLEGVRITHDHMLKLLHKHGVYEIEAAGKPFNPEFHEAMMRQAATDVEPMTVLDVLAKGYTMHGRTIRPARVVVAVAPDAE